MVSASVQAALDKAAARAARLAESDAAAGPAEGEVAEPVKKKRRQGVTDEELESAKAKSCKFNPASDERMAERVHEVKAKLERTGSTVSTIPATKAELAAVKRSDSQVTPPPKKDKKHRSKDESAPQEAGKGRPRSPTLHYSPSAPTQEASQAKLTAVKAKAAPTTKAKPAKAKAAATDKSGASKLSPKAEKPDESTAKAMQSTLQRANTVDLKTTVAAAPEPSSDDDEDSSQASEGEENPEGVTVQQLRERKALRARYMRFSRSLKSKKSPREIRLAGEAAYRCSDRLAVLFEQWVGCEGHWRESALYQRLRVESRFRKRGCRKWLTELTQYLVWDEDAEEEVEDTVTSSFFEAVDRDRETEKTGTEEKQKTSVKKNKKKKAGKKTKKAKKSKGRKRKSTSSSSTSSESEQSSSSSSSVT
eukprot:s127_g22.t1